MSTDEQKELARKAKDWWSSLSLNEQKAFKVKHLGETYPNVSVYTKSGANIVTIWKGEGQKIVEK